MRLIRYIIRRLLTLVPVLLLVSALTFTATHLLPWSPVYLLLGEDVDEVTVARMTSELGLDKPLPVQYAIYLRNLLRGDLGWAFHTGRPVVDDIKDRLPATLELTFAALLVAIVAAIPLGIFSAIRKGSVLDHVARVVTLIGLCIPVFWLGLIAIYFFFFKLRIFPAPFGRIALDVDPPAHITGAYLVDSLLTGNVVAFRSSLQHIALPALSQAFVIMAPLARMTRASMIRVLESDYMRAARAAGIPARTIHFRYALKNALLPTITLIGLIFGFALGGNVMIEKVFSWPGIGSYALDSISLTDYAAVQGYVLLSAALYVFIFLLVDLVYFAVDPRIEY